MMTRDESEQEAENVLQGKSWRAHARPSFVAFLEHSNNLPLDQECPYCHGRIEIDDHGTAWTVRCPCGQCADTFRGL